MLIYPRIIFELLVDDWPEREEALLRILDDVVILEADDKLNYSLYTHNNNLL